MARYNDLTIKPNPTNKGNTGRNTQIYRGISTVNPDSKNYNLYDINLIKQDLLNHFQIRKGEKINNPESGSIIWNTLYEPLTQETRDAITADVSTIVNNDPRVSVDALSIVEKDYGIQIAVTLSYLKYSIKETLRLNFDRDNGLIAQ